MAGYRKSGAEDFVNATSFNKQIERQREAYQNGSTSTMGVSSQSSLLFPDMRSEILTASVDTMNSLDSSLPRESGNPDFIPAIDFAHGNALSMYDDLINAKDKPSRKGPNLIAPDINNLTSETSEVATIPEERQNKGFGWRDERNEPGTPAATIGTYFSSHYNSSGDNSDVSRPVLGESKNPSEDPNIIYSQPE